MRTGKDYQRMTTLIAYARENGMHAGIDKAIRDADKIEHIEKCEARASILERESYAVLATPFRNRAAYLRASGVTS